MLAADSLLGWLEAKASDDVRVAVARARLFEWRRRDPQLALDVVEAARWHLIAKAAGIADESLDKILAKLSKADRAQAQKAADAWRDRTMIGIE